MKKMRLRSILSAAVALAAMPIAAHAASPEGNWASGPKDLRYEIRFCSEDSKELCGWLTYAIDPDPRVQKHVGQQVITNAQPIGPEAWKGSIYIAGFTMNGTMRLAEPDRIEIDGCVMFVICGVYNIYRE